MLAALCLSPIEARAQKPSVCRLDTLGTALNVSSPQGLWRTAGAVFAITPVPGQADRYQLRILACEDMSLPPDMLAGTMIATGRPRSFRGEFLAELKGRRKNRFKATQTIEMVFDESWSHIDFKEAESGLKIDLLRFLPYYYRGGIHYKDGEEASTAGAVRIHPGRPQIPVVL